MSLRKFETKNLFGWDEQLRETYVQGAMAGIYLVADNRVVTLRLSLVILLNFELFTILKQNLKKSHYVSPLEYVTLKLTSSYLICMKHDTLLNIASFRSTLVIAHAKTFVFFILYSYYIKNSNRILAYRFFFLTTYKICMTLLQKNYDLRTFIQVNGMLGRCMSQQQQMLNRITWGIDFF